jgi:RNA polymerase sigma factor (sigma-70 family)
MEVSALKYSGGIGLHGRSPLLRLQSDERLVGLVRRGNTAAFELLVSRYESRLLAFSRHLVGSREDAEDVLQEVFAAAYNAMLGDDRPINVRPWLYRIARNRSLNHLRKTQALGVDSMDVHLSENGATTADKVHEREEFRMLVRDIHDLPETQRTALVLREMDAMSYEQIAEAMETTVPSVKSLLVRARVSLADAAEARLLTCDDVRTELGEVAEGLLRKPSPLVRRHLKSCRRCESFQHQLKETNKALAAVLPVGPFVLLRKLALTHLGHSAGSSATAAGSTAGAGTGAAGATAAGTTAAAGSTIAVGSGAGGFVSAGVGAIATKAAAGLAAAALVTAGAVEVSHSSKHLLRPHATFAAAVPMAAGASQATSGAGGGLAAPVQPVKQRPDKQLADKKLAAKKAAFAKTAVKTQTTATRTATVPATTTPAATTPPGRTDTTTTPTVLPPTATPTSTTPEPESTTPAPTDTSTTPAATSSTTTTTPTTTSTAPTTTSTTPTTTSTTPTTTSTTPTTTSTTPTGTSTTPTSTEPTGTSTTPSSTTPSG